MDLESLAQRNSQIEEKSKRGKDKYPVNIKAQALKYTKKYSGKLAFLHSDAL